MRKPCDQTISCNARTSNVVLRVSLVSLNSVPMPTLEQRLATRAHGVASPVMYQRWSQLLFLHWKWDADELQKRLPPGLFIDTFQGEAWLGIVPFFMERIRPRFLPPVPWISWFLELNVRTYVHDEKGTPGVWFFSLDCNHPVAVRIARAGFGLPYFDARMSAPIGDDGIRYECARRGQAQSARFQYQLANDAHVAEPGSLEFFLAERYTLFASTPRGLRLGRVQHVPYPLATATVTAFDPAPIIWDGLGIPAGAPDHIIGSPGVDVRIGALERL